MSNQQQQNSSTQHSSDYESRNNSGWSSSWNSEFASPNNSEWNSTQCSEDADDESYDVISPCCTQPSEDSSDGDEENTASECAATYDSVHTKRMPERTISTTNTQKFMYRPPPASATGNRRNLVHAEQFSQPPSEQPHTQPVGTRRQYRPQARRAQHPIKAGSQPTRSNN